MKKVLVMTTLILGGLATSCGNSGETESGAEKTSANGMDGTWKIVKAEGSMADLNVGTLYIFEGDNMTLKGGGISTPGTYSTSGDTLIFTMEGNAEFTYLHEMKGKQLVIKPIGSDQVLYLDKQ